MVTVIAEELQLIKPRIEVMIAEYNAKYEPRLFKKDIAAHLEISPQYLTKLLKGTAKDLNTEKLFKLANLLKCSVDDLYEYREE